MQKFLLRRLGVAHDPGGVKPTLQGCLEAVLEQSDALVDDVLDGLKLGLEPVKGGKPLISPSNQLARDTVGKLLAQPAAVKTLFGQALRAALYGGESQRKTAQPLVRFDDFQFLEEEQIDANIEQALTQQEVQMAVEDVLPMLNALVSSLLGWVTVQAHLNPLKPESFVHALREALNQQVPDEAARASVMTFAAGKLGLSLRVLYKELSDWLRSQGIEPVAMSVVASGPGGAAKPVENTVTRTMLTLDKLRRLLSGELDPSPGVGGIKDFMHTVPASFDALQDMKMVEPMMKRLAERASLAAVPVPGAPVLPKVRASRNAKQSEGKKLGLQLGEEVVRLMLENLLKDHRMLAKVRASIKALEPALHKLSQIDPRFFSERQHPARQFLDKMTHRSLAYSSEDQPGFARFLKSFDNAVQVLTAGEGDAASFARMLRKLEESWQRDEAEQRAKAEEAARGLLHAEQRNLLAQRLSAEFMVKLLNKAVPDIVTTFLRGPWSQVVAEAQLRFADGSGDASEYQALVDDLIWSVQVKLAARNRARLVQLVPSMLVKMRQGLHLVDYPEERMTAFFDALISVHEKAFEAARPATSEVAPAEAGAPLTVTPVQDSAPLTAEEGLWVAESEAADSGFLRDAAIEEPPELPETAEPGEAQEWTADELVIGSWVDLALAGQWVRAQLTWASPHRTLFMFISGAGLAHSMSRRSMDRLRGLGLIRLVSDGRVMDNALDAVARTALRNDMGHAGDD